jgi:hypothetical protein
MKNIALDKLRTGSCDASKAASKYLLRRNWEVIGPPKGSASVNPAEALAPIMTIRDQGLFSGAFDAAEVLPLSDFWESAAETASATKPSIRKKTTRIEPISVFDFILSAEARSMLYMKDNPKPPGDLNRAREFCAAA